MCSQYQTKLGAVLRYSSRETSTGQELMGDGDKCNGPELISLGEDGAGDETESTAVVAKRKMGSANSTCRNPCIV
jgi:hypothetical protein